MAGSRSIARATTIAIAVAVILAAVLGYSFGSTMRSVQTTTSTTVTTISSIHNLTQTLAQTTFDGSPSIGAITLANISVSESLWGVAANPSNNKIYAPECCNINAGITVISGANATTTVQVPGGSLYVAVNPITGFVYVNNDSCPPCTQSISVINGSSNKVVGGINLGTYVDGIAVNPKTDTIFASSADTDSLFVVNGATNSLAANISLPGSAMMVAVNPATNMVYVPVCTISSACTPAYVFVISGSNYAIVSKLPIDLPFAIAVNSATNMIYVTTAQNLLVGINGTTVQETETRLSAYALQCRGIDVNQASNEIYVSCSATQGLPSFFIVDGSDYNILNSFVDNGGPMGVAFDSNNSMIYLAHSNGYVLVLQSTEMLLP